MLLNVIDGRIGRTTILKVKCRLDTEGPSAIQGRESDLEQLVGNTLADQVADIAAERNRPDTNALKSAKRCETFGFTVAKRLAIIQACIWEEQKDEARLFDLDFLIEPSNLLQSQSDADMRTTLVDNGHRLYRKGKGFSCDNCKTYRSIRNFSFWANASCKPRPPASLLVRSRLKERARLSSAQPATKDTASHQPSKKARVNSSVFDDPEVGAISEEGEDDLFYSQSERPESSSLVAPERQEVSVPFRGKRLHKKSKPADTVYYNIRPRGSRAEHNARKRANYGVLRANERHTKHIKATAIRTMINSTNIINGSIDRQGLDGIDERYNWGFANAIHVSHLLRVVNSSNEAFFCTRCGYYNDGGALKALKKPCPGKVDGERAHLHRLLTRGQLPKDGTRLEHGR